MKRAEVSESACKHLSASKSIEPGACNDAFASKPGVEAVHPASRASFAMLFQGVRNRGGRF